MLEATVKPWSVRCFKNRQEKKMLQQQRIYRALNPSDRTCQLNIFNQTYMSVAEYAYSKAAPMTGFDSLFEYFGRKYHVDAAARQYEFFLFLVDTATEDRLFLAMYKWLQKKLSEQGTMLEAFLVLTTTRAFSRATSDSLFTEALIYMRRLLAINELENGGKL